MGSLIAETPFSEVTATLEWLDTLGLTRDDLKNLRKGPDWLKAELVSLLGGNIIDCGDPPPSEWGWDAHGVIEHIPGGRLVFAPSAVELYQSPKQLRRGTKGIELYEDLKGRHPLNILVLQFLLQKPFLIPEEWRDGRRIYFFGTTWRTRYGDGTEAAYMEMVGRGDERERRGWDTKVTWLEGNDFSQRDYVALAKS